MKNISYDDIRSLQEELDELPLFDSQEKMRTVYLDQPYLSQYVVDANDELDDELAKYVLYFFSLIYLAIKDSHQDTVPLISEENIVKAHDNNIDLLEKLESTSDNFIEKITENSFKEQSGIYRFIVESIFEELPEISDLTEDDEGWIFLVLKSTIDVLSENIK